MLRQVELACSRRDKPRPRRRHLCQPVTPLREESRPASTKLPFLPLYTGKKYIFSIETSLFQGKHRKGNKGARRTPDDPRRKCGGTRNAAKQHAAGFENRRSSFMSHESVDTSVERLHRFPVNPVSDSCCFTGELLRFYQEMQLVQCCGLPLQDSQGPWGVSLSLIHPESSVPLPPAVLLHTSKYSIGR